MHSRPARVVRRHAKWPPVTTSIESPGSPSCSRRPRGRTSAGARSPKLRGRPRDRFLSTEAVVAWQEESGTQAPSPVVLGPVEGAGGYGVSLEVPGEPVDAGTPVPIGQLTPVPPSPQ